MRKTTQPSRDESCPVCRSSAEPILELKFPSKPPLPSSVCFRCCDVCDLIFAQTLDAEAYRTFYSSVLNDTGHVNDGDPSDNLYAMQAALICDYIGANFQGNCLDFGSGEGQLLRFLIERLPAATFYGTDLRNSLRGADRIKFLPSLDATSVRFDLIILSHVAEHFVNLSDLSKLVELLAPEGAMYIEVPDPTAYAEYPRREFMYYFDRLHVNHFSRHALESWLASYDLEIEQFGTHAFAYRDGKYPAQFVFARLGKMRVSQPKSAGTLRLAFEAYRASELLRAQKLRREIADQAGSRNLVVYGGGDNCYRAMSPGGPLSHLPIKAILDRNAELCAATSGPPVLIPSQGLAEYPDAVVLMTVSAGAEKIVDEISAGSYERTVIMI